MSSQEHSKKQKRRLRRQIKEIDLVHSSDLETQVKFYSAKKKYLLAANAAEQHNEPELALHLTRTQVHEDESSVRYLEAARASRALDNKELTDKVYSRAWERYQIHARIISGVKRYSDDQKPEHAIELLLKAASMYEEPAYLGMASLFARQRGNTEQAAELMREYNAKQRKKVRAGMLDKLLAIALDNAFGVKQKGEGPEKHLGSDTATEFSLKPLEQLLLHNYINQLAHETGSFDKAREIHAMLGAPDFKASPAQITFDDFKNIYLMEDETSNPAAAHMLDLLSPKRGRYTLVEGSADRPIRFEGGIEDIRGDVIYRGDISVKGNIDRITIHYKGEDVFAVFEHGNKSFVVQKYNKGVFAGQYSLEEGKPGLPSHTQWADMQDGMLVIDMESDNGREVIKSARYGRRLQNKIDFEHSSKAWYDFFTGAKLREIRNAEWYMETHLSAEDKKSFRYNIAEELWEIVGKVFSGEKHGTPAIDRIVMAYDGGMPSGCLNIDDLAENKVVGWFVLDVKDRIFKFLNDRQLAREKDKDYREIAGVLVVDGKVVMTNNAAHPIYFTPLHHGLSMPLIDVKAEPGQQLVVYDPTKDHPRIYQGIKLSPDSYLAFWFHEGIRENRCISKVNEDITDKKAKEAEGERDNKAEQNKAEKVEDKKPEDPKADDDAEKRHSILQELLKTYVANVPEDVNKDAPKKQDLATPAYGHEPFYAGIEAILTAPELALDLGALIHRKAAIPWQNLGQVVNYVESMDSRYADYLNKFFDQIWSIPEQRSKQISLHDKIKAYIAAYIRAPIATIQNENRILVQNPKLPLNWLVNQLVGLHSQIQDALFLPTENHVSRNPERFYEVKNAWFLSAGDYRPETRFVLGRPETYRCELFRIESDHPLAFESLVQAKLGAIEIARTGRFSLDDIALDIFLKFQRLYSDWQDNETYAAKTIGAGRYMEEGGCCRHRGVSLAYAYQEAGILAQVTRGVVFSPENQHVWVFIYKDPTRNPAIIADPNIIIDDFPSKHGISNGFMQNIENVAVEERAGIKYIARYQLPEPRNVIWRAKI